MTGPRVRDVMTSEVVVVAPNCGYERIVDVLVDSKVSAVPVVEDGVVVGIVSEADLLHKGGPVPTRTAGPHAISRAVPWSPSIRRHRSEPLPG